MRRISTYAILAIVLILCFIRIVSFDVKGDKTTQVLTWDAFGYYILLPAVIIYDDCTKYHWVEPINTKYQVTGITYQLSELPNGNKVMKYLLGVSILYLPFFLVGHFAAVVSGFPPDGFSIPYQAAISLASMVYALVGLFILQKVLRRYFSEIITGTTLVLIALVTNYPQYVAIESGMAHGYIFTQYAFLLWLTIKWHEKPNKWIAGCIGLIIGLGIMSRPTEIVMLFIPILYGMQNRIACKEKWSLVRANPGHLLYAIPGGFIGIAPQLLYWKTITGSWIYDVGSKFSFFPPHWQVLFGWEKGWFIYTPIAVAMIVGIALLRNNPFQKSIVYFTLFNIWIVIAWSDWHYGATYSARALVQSYPVLAIPLAGFLSKSLAHNVKYLMIPLLIALIGINLFQIYQYNKTILHYRDMNKAYYKAIFLDKNPTPMDMSLLDTQERIQDMDKYVVSKTIHIDTLLHINKAGNSTALLLYYPFERNPINTGNDSWIQVTLQDSSAWGAFDTYVYSVLHSETDTVETKIRMHNGICKSNAWNTIAFQIRIPARGTHYTLTLTAKTAIAQDIFIRNVEVLLLDPK